MKLHLIAATAAVLLSAAASSAGAASIVTAKLEAPLAMSVRPIAGSAVFVCAADTCTAVATNSDTGSRTACRQLVRVVGPVSAFGSEAKPLSSEQLAACNTAAKK